MVRFAVSATLYDMGRTAIDLTDQKFGEWTVLGRSLKSLNKSAYWRCRCSCGDERDIQSASLRSGGTTMCKPCRSKRLETHAMSRTTEYKVWLGIKQRCLNPRNSSWLNYGGRGVTISPIFKGSFEAFLAEIGPRPTRGHTVDRIDNQCGYEPGNIRWSTAQEQALNTRRNVRWEHDGKRLTISQWGTKLGVDPNTLRQRVVECGWTVEKALTTPILGGG